MKKIEKKKKSVDKNGEYSAAEHQNIGFIQMRSCRSDMYDAMENEDDIELARIIHHDRIAYQFIMTAMLCDG